MAQVQLLPFMKAVKGFKLTRHWLKMAQAYDCMTNISPSPSFSLCESAKSSIIRSYLVGQDFSVKELHNALSNLQKSNKLE